MNKINRTHWTICALFLDLLLASKIIYVSDKLVS